MPLYSSYSSPLRLGFHLSGRPTLLWLPPLWDGSYPWHASCQWQRAGLEPAFLISRCFGGAVGLVSTHHGLLNGQRLECGPAYSNYAIQLCGRRNVDSIERSHSSVAERRCTQLRRERAA